MRKMKDSGIEWIGEIPEDKNIIRNKYAIQYIKGKNPIELNNAKLGLPYIGASDLDKEMNFEEYENYTLEQLPTCDYNDILILWDGARAGLIGRHHKGIISSTIVKLEIDETCILKKFYYWYIRGLEKYINNMVNGTTIPHMNRKFIENIVMINFSLEEQEIIADYLDSKVSEIDNIISKTKETIEEYKKYKQSVITEAVTKGLNPNVEMKDSGIEWIGEIPKHWKISMLKFFTNKIGSGKTPLGGANIYSDKGVPFFRSQNIYNEGLDKKNLVYISEDIDETMKNSRVLNGDILLNITGGSIGRCCIYNDDITANVNQHVCIIRTIQEYIINSYLYYMLVSSIGLNEIYSCQTGGNREGITFEQISNFKIPILDIKEQKDICIYLDKKCNEIDKLISKKQNLITELEQYKKSLIYECVTGKKEVSPAYAD